MLLSDYKWSNNPRGMHSQADGGVRMNMQMMLAMKMGWAKLVVFTDIHLKDIPTMLANNITPIVRVWSPKLAYSAPDDTMMRLYRTYFDAGVRWFELQNEPNLEALPHNYQDVPNTIAPLMINWMNWSETIIQWGGYPAFPALAEASTASESSTLWLDAMLTYVRDNHFDRFRGIINSGAWCATHSATLNHFYQEDPIKRNRPRDISTQNGLEGGWHFEYPYDPICQANDPGRTVFGGTPLTPYGDSSGLTAMGLAFMQRFSEWFGGNMIPVVSTEGGVFPVPGPVPVQPDTRYPPYDRASHAEATIAMFKYLAQDAPPWFFGMCMWKEDDYLSTPDGRLPAVDRLINTPVFTKVVPPIPAFDKPISTPVPLRGPGPIHGSPDYHFMLVAPDFSSDWFFADVQAFWARYRPDILLSIDYIAYVPFEKSLVVTVFSSSEKGDLLTKQLHERWPNVWVNLITAKSQDELREILANSDKFKYLVRTPSK